MVIVDERLLSAREEFKEQIEGQKRAEVGEHDDERNEVDVPNLELGVTTGHHYDSANDHHNNHLQCLHSLCLRHTVDRAIKGKDQVAETGRQAISADEEVVNVEEHLQALGGVAEVIYIEYLFVQESPVDAVEVSASIVFVRFPEFASKEFGILNVGPEVSLSFFEAHEFGRSVEDEGRDYKRLNCYDDCDAR